MNQLDAQHHLIPLDFNPKLVRFSVDGSTATPASGVVETYPASRGTRIKLDPEDEDSREFEITGWYDANNNGKWDKDETAYTLKAVVVEVDQSIQFVDKDNPTNTTWSNWSSSRHRVCRKRRGDDRRCASPGHGVRRAVAESE